ncbi:hypothetical protein LguiB_008298 [Lonicera macranthoides]
MMNDLHNSDPLNAHSFFSLLPRAFKDSKLPQKPKDSDELEPIHIYMKSMALKSPDKLFKEAKTYVEGPVELPNRALGNSDDVVILAKGKDNPQGRRVPLARKQDQIYSNPNTSMDTDQMEEPEEYFLAHDMHEASENNSEAVTAEDKENHQVRRPGLGRKRAQFSLKPTTSQPSFSLEPTLDIYQLQDPDEFFSAYDKLENAKKEIQRQMGSNMIDVKANNPSINTTRSRRPGLLGRSVSYRHSYSSVLSETDDILINSQETLHQDIPTSSNCDTKQQKTNPNVQLKEKGSDGLLAKTKNRVGEVWDEVSSTTENLDGDVALSIIQESLQIKPIDLDKLCLPNFHDIEMPDFASLGEKIPQARKSFRSNMGKGISSKTPLQHKQVPESPVHPLTSPTPPKSPFASISLLKKRILHTSPLSNPFSTHNIDEPAINPFVEVLDQQLGNADTSKEFSISGKLKSPVKDGTRNTTVTNKGSQKVIGGDTLHSDMLVHDNPSKLGLDVGAGLSKSHDDVADHDWNKSMDGRVMNDSVGRMNVDFDSLVHGDNNLQEHAEDMMQEAASCGQPDIDIEGSSRSHTDTDVIKQNGLSEVEENLEEMRQEAAPSVQPDVNIENSRIENLKDSPTQLDQQNSCVDNTLVQPYATPEISTEQHKEEQPRISINEAITAKRPREGRKRKLLSHRQSLAESGLLWNLGVRRSSRIKRRPLEYWKGERFLYGRVHESLPTVIGVKYISPTKGNANPTFRVQSYVSDDYKELVELAALH